MRKSLFALENDDSLNNPAEMEVSGEEGEAAAALTEAGDDASEIAEVAEAASEGTEAADQLGQVEELVEDAVENGEGLDPVAAEAVRISVEAICGRIGANPRAVYSLYATENFQSASSRKANSRIALEGIGEFLKNLYEKIKAALTNMWAKIKAFWAKHISTLGRVKKALEAMKAKVAASSGKIDGRAQLDEAPSSMVDAFAGKGAINATVVGKFIAAHKAMNDLTATTSAKITEVNNLAASKPGTGKIAEILSNVKNIELGSNQAPLVNGVYILYEVEKESDTDKVNITVSRNTIDDKEVKRSFIIADKAEVKTALDEALGVINITIKSRDLTDKESAAVQKFMQAIGKAVNDLEKSQTANGRTQSEDQKKQVEELRRQLSQVYNANAKWGGIPVEAMNQNIRLAKAVLSFASICLKNYK